MKKRMQGVMLGLSLAIGLCVAGTTAQAYSAAEMSDKCGLEPLNVTVLTEAETEALLAAERMAVFTETADDVVTEEERAYWTQFSDTYIYTTLNEQEKAFWKNMEEACLTLAATTTDYTGYGMKVYYDSSISRERLVNLMFMFQYNNPQYYFVANSVSLSSSYAYLNVYDLFADGEARAGYTKQFTEKIDSWLETIAQQERPEQKVKAAHDIICLNTVYSFADYNQSAYSMVCLGKTVCAGYAKTMNLLGNAAGIETVAVTSPNHAWNLVKLHGVWYELDATWDDTDSTGDFADYWCYNKSRATIADSAHTMEEEYASVVPATLYDMSVSWDYQNPYIEVDGNTYFIVNDNKELAACMVKFVEGTGQVPTSVTYNDKEYQVVEDLVLSGSCGEAVNWKLNDSGTLSVSGMGEMYGFMNESDRTLLERPWDSILDKIECVVIETGVTNLGAGAFYGCSNLKKIIVGDSVATIGDSALRNCKALRAVEVSEENLSFKGVDGVLYSKDGKALILYPSGKTDTKYAIATETMKIEQFAVECANYLEEIEIPEGVAEMAPYAITDCDNLYCLVFPASLQYISEYNACACDNLKYLTNNSSVELVLVKWEPGAWVDANGNEITLLKTGETAYRGIPGQIPSPWKADYTGLYTLGQNTWYVSNGRIDYSYTGLLFYEGEWWYIAEGRVAYEYTGLSFVNEKWWYVIAGKIDFSYTGFADANGATWYIISGEVAFDYNGLVYVNDEWYYIVGGRLDTGYNGMAYVNDAWWYVASGKVDFSFTGLTFVNEKWWYVNAGRIDFTYHGICEFNGAIYYIENGEINYAAAGLVCVGTVWYFVENGCVRTDYSGMLFVNDAWWYVVNGKIDFEFSGLFLFNNDYWLVSQGKIVLGYIGLVFYDNQWWYLENGVVNVNYNGFAFVNDIWWWVEGGKIDFTHTGIHQFNGVWWYVVNAQIDFTYNGTVTDTDGNLYEVVNGEVLNYSL